MDKTQTAPVPAKAAEAPEARSPDPSCKDPTCEQHLVLGGEVKMSSAGHGRAAVRSPVVSGGVEGIQQALSTSEATIQATPGFAMAESASAAMVGSDGTWQTSVFSNVMTGAGEAAQVDYGCIRGSTTICDHDWPFGGAGSDPSMVVGGGFTYSIRLFSSGASSGTLWLRSSNPCPASCATATWGNCSAAMPADWTQVAKADATNVWTVYNDFSTNGDFNNAITMSKLAWCSNVSWFKLSSQCTSINVKNRRNPHGAVGGNGLIHVVYANLSDSTVEYTNFDTNTNLWKCTPVVLGTLAAPPGACSGGSAKVFPTIGNANLEFTAAPRIARDSVSGALVATWDSYDSSVNKVRSRAFRSLDGGVTWSWTFLTPGETAHSSIAVGTAHRFEIGQTYETGNHQAAQVRYKSTDDGGSWAGVFLSASRALAPVIPTYAPRPCHWGDYDGVTYHSGNDAFYHTWVDTNQGSVSVVRGLFSTN